MKNRREKKDLHTMFALDLLIPKGLFTCAISHCVFAVKQLTLAIDNKVENKVEFECVLQSRVKFIYSENAKQKRNEESHV